MKQTEFNKLDKSERQTLLDSYVSKNQFFAIELSPSSRAKCRLCLEIIDKNSLRLRHVTCNNSCRKSSLDVCGNWHLSCFKDEQQRSLDRFKHSNPDFVKVNSVNQLVGFEELDKDLQKSAEIQLEI